MAKFNVGDRVKVVKPHMNMKKGDRGTVREVSAETPYAVRMDGEHGEPHKWYTDSELEKV